MDSKEIIKGFCFYSSEEVRVRVMQNALLPKHTQSRLLYEVEMVGQIEEGHWNDNNLAYRTPLIRRCSSFYWGNALTEEKARDSKQKEYPDARYLGEGTILKRILFENES